MGLVVGDILLVICVVAGVGLSAFFIARKRDAEELQARSKQDEQERQRIMREAQRLKPGVPLICLNCETRFAGPLTSTGCPHCNLTTLVVTEEEYRSTSNSR
jgi:rubrerythrin